MLDGLNNPATFWLTVTNVSFGVVIAVFAALVLGGLVLAVVARVRVWVRRPGVADPHTLEVPGLGTTMADGGEPVAAKPSLQRRDSR